MSTVKLFQGDCLEIMKNISEASIDLICCDLPYGTTSCAWDSVIPFDKLWEHYGRILKPDGVVILFGSQPFTTQMIQSNIKWFREELIWLKNKPASGMLCDKRHMKIHENIEIFSPVGDYTYNPQKWLISDKDFITQRKTFKENEYIGNQIYGATTRTRKPDTGERNPISIMSCQVPFTPQKSKSYSNDLDLRYHPTQKPIELLTYLIKTYSNECDLILDNCSGSGSLAVACHNTHRNFICIEKDKKYYDLSVERYNNAKAQLRLF